MKILGIETSCDDTGIAIYDSKKGLLKNYLYNQKKYHNKHYGIVPELAARLHTKYVVKLIKKCFSNNIYKLNDIDLIAYTAGPGLVGSLLVGSTIATSLAFALKIPIVFVNHLEAHLLSALMEHKNLKFPFLTLLVSGKNTQLILAKNLGNYKILGSTLDNSVGEVFDKVARNLGLKYPGGPEIYKISKYSKRIIYDFPKPMFYSKCFNFSFSGLKTAVIRTIKKKIIDFKIKADIAKSFQISVIDILTKKTFLCLKKYNLCTLVVSGGVSANLLLRKKFISLSKKNKKNIFFTSIKLCTDNGAMIAYTGYLKYINKRFYTNPYIFVKNKWSVEKSWNF